MPFNLSTGEIVVLLIVAVLVFGGRLPDVARKVARGVGEFRRGMSDEMRRVESTLADEQGPPDNWRPPDGADCDGFGRFEPEKDDAEPETAGPEAAPAAKVDAPAEPTVARDEKPTD
ncbi:MAG: Sec-independent protein translocase subunit TatA/TatB [Planctomycetota bacterium]|jgi:TatA/E family protein of Tat protein translocase